MIIPSGVKKEDKLFEQAISSIMKMIPKERHSVLNKAKAYSSRKKAIVIFNDLYAFLYIALTKEVLCINGAAKTIGIDSLQYTPVNLNMIQAEKTMNIKGRIIWKKE